MTDLLRCQIRSEIESIVPADEVERAHIDDALAWLESGAPLFRVQKPATPPRHLVSYFVCVDGSDVLLTDHISAQLWLPTGGHVEHDEHPRSTVLREAREELGIAAEFLQPAPLMLSIAETQGQSVRHTDVSLWYLLHLSRTAALTPDLREFHELRWFTPDEVPRERSDPNIDRFLRKLAALTPAPD